MADGKIIIDIDTKTEQLDVKLAKLSNRLDQLTKQRAEMANAKVPTADYEALEKELIKISNQYERLIERKQKFLDTGGSTKSKAFQSLQYDIGNTKALLTDLRAEMEYMRNSGQAYEAPDLTKIDLDIADTTAKMKAAQSQMDGMSKRTSGLSTVFHKMGETARNAGKALLNIAGHAKKAGASLVKAFRAPLDPIEKIMHRIKGLALRVFMFSLITKAFRGMVSSIKEGFSALEKTNADYKAMMDGFRSATAGLRNALIDAFYPIMQLIIPWLTDLVNMLASAITTISAFFTALSGGTKKAVTDTTAYGKALDKTGGSAKKTKNELAAFDDLNVLNKNDNSGGGAGSTAATPAGAGDLFDLDNFTPYGAGKALANWLKDALEDIDWETIKKEAENIGRKIAQFFNAIWEDKQLAADIGKAIAEALNTAVNFVYGLVDETEWEELGTWLATVINNFFSTFDFVKAGLTLSKLAEGILDALIAALEETNFEQIGEKIGEFLANIKWRKIFFKAGRAIWLAINGVIDILKGMFNAAPIETTIIAACAALKFTGLGAKMASAMWEEIKMIPAHLWGVIKDTVISLWTFFSNTASTEFITTLARMNPEMLAHVEWMLERWFASTEIGSKVNKAINAFYDWIGDAIAMLFDTSHVEALFKDAWDNIKDAFNGNNDIITAGRYIVNGIGEGIMGALETLALPIVNLFDYVYDKICEVFDINSPAETMKPLGQYILEGIVEGFSGAVDEMTTAIENFFNETIMPWFTTDKWVEIFNSVYAAILQKWKEIQLWWKNTWKTITTAFDNIKKQCFEAGFAWAEALYNGFGAVVNGIVGIVNECISAIEAMINEIIDNINDLIEEAAKLASAFGIPVKAPKIDHIEWGRVPALQLPALEVPKLANGGVTVGATLAQIGEAGREAVLPLDQNTGWQEELAESLASHMPSAGGTAVIEINGRELARVTMPYFDAENNRVGTRLAVN